MGIDKQCRRTRPDGDNHASDGQHVELDMTGKHANGRLRRVTLESLAISCEHALFIKLSPMSLEKG